MAGQAVAVTRHGKTVTCRDFGPSISATCERAGRKSGGDRPPFDPRIFLAKVGDGKAISKYQKGQIVFSQGELADAVFYIQMGRIKLTVVSERGKEAVVGILEPKHFFGEGCLNGHPLRVTTATAIDQSLITRITKAAMITTLHDQPEFSELFMADLLNRNSRIEEDLIDQLFNSSEKRLARVLLLLANFGKEATVEPIIGKFSQETLAEMIGTTRSRVSFFMNKFRKLGYIEYNGKLEIRSSLLNVVLYDKPEIGKDDASNGPRWRPKRNPASKSASPVTSREAFCSPFGSDLRCEADARRADHAALLEDRLHII